MLLARFFGVFFSGNSFAALIADRAARFACGLAGASAFSAASYFLFRRFCYRFNHNKKISLDTSFV